MNNIRRTRLAVGLAVIAALAASGRADDEPSLKRTYQGDFLIGAAIDEQLFANMPELAPVLVKRHYNSVTSKNLLKWSEFNPQPGVYRHELADAFVRFGTQQQMHVVGHVLFWHKQTPPWVFRDAAGGQLGREQLLKRMRERVSHLAQRYGNHIHAWDVVNEAYHEDGSLRDIPWTRILGGDYVEQAFRIAAAELPRDVELIYNDYNMHAAGRRKAVVGMIRDLKQKGVRVDAVGMQGHWSLDHPSIEEIEASIVAFWNAGVKVHITELDIDVLPHVPGMHHPELRKDLAADARNNPYPNGLPEDMQRRLAGRYADLFGLFYKHRDKIGRVTTWGVTDGDSWLNNQPIRGRTNHPLLFDREGRPKAACRMLIGLKGKPVVRNP